MDNVFQIMNRSFRKINEMPDTPDLIFSTEEYLLVKIIT